MAAIGNIRKHSGILIALIGGAMLLFVLGDFLTQGSVFFTGPNDEIGSINGNKVSYAEFETRTKNMIEQANGPVDDQNRQQIRNEVWNQFIRENLLLPEYQDLGLSVTDEEILYIIKNQPNTPSLKQYFTDPNTGQVISQFAKPDGSLDGNTVLAYLKQYVFVDDPSAAESKAGWLNFQENYLRKPLLDNKYNTLIAHGIIITDVEQENSYVAENSNISFSYVAQFYNDVADSTVEVSDSDLKTYYNKHKSEDRFDQKEPIRSLSFISFEVSPSMADKEKLEEELMELKSQFENASDDTLFVNENGDTPFNIKWVGSNTFRPDVDSVIMHAAINTVIGPFEEANKFNLVKVLDRKIGADSVMASHILIPITDKDTATAQATVDSLMNALDNGEDFAALATAHSKDPGSAAKGGDLGWFTEGKMVPEFNDVCFDPENKAGAIKQATSQFGIHIIKVVEKTEPKEKVLVAIVDNVIEPSDETYEKAYNKASAFAINNDNADKFLSAGDSIGILQAPSLRESDLNVMGMENTRQIVRWAFEAEVGEVSEAFDLGDQFVIALITEARDKGILPFEMVKDEISVDVIKEKKAEKLMAEMDNETDLNALANKLGTAVQPVSQLPFGSFSIPGLGPEQKLIGQAFSLEIGDISKPIDGERGVYVINITAKTVAEPKIDEAARKAGMTQLKSRVGYQVINALRNEADIEDNRAKFF